MYNIKNLHVLVTGAAGFIGSNFVKHLLAQHYSVTVLDALTYAGHRENLEEFDNAENFKFVQGSIGDGPLVKKILHEDQVRFVLNFAAESHVDRSIHGPSAFIETNIIGTFTLLSESLEYWNRKPPEEKKHFRFLQVSTDEVYGSLGPTGKFSETSQYMPNSPYSASKAAADHLVRAWHHTYGLPTITTNCSNNYGPKQFPEKLIPHMIQCALANKQLPIYGDGGNIRDWIYVDDHCAGILLALQKGKPGSTYCFGGNAERTNLELVSRICSILDEMKPRQDGKSYSTLKSFVEDRLGHDRRYAIDDTLAESELGFSRRFDFNQGLKSTVGWYLDNQNWIQQVMNKGPY